MVRSLVLSLASLGLLSCANTATPTHYLDTSPSVPLLIRYQSAPPLGKHRQYPLEVAVRVEEEPAPFSEEFRNGVSEMAGLIGLAVAQDINRDLEGKIAQEVESLGIAQSARPYSRMGNTDYILRVNIVDSRFRFLKPTDSIRSSWGRAGTLRGEESDRTPFELSLGAEVSVLTSLNTVVERRVVRPR